MPPANRDDLPCNKVEDCITNAPTTCEVIKPCITQTDYPSLGPITNKCEAYYVTQSKNAIYYSDASKNQLWGGTKSTNKYQCVTDGSGCKTSTTKQCGPSTCCSCPETNHDDS